MDFQCPRNEYVIQLQDSTLVMTRCRYFQRKRDFLNLTRSQENLWEVHIPADEMSLSDTAVLLQFCSELTIDALVLSRYSLEFLLKFSDFFDCDFLLIEYFHFFIQRDLLLTIKDFFQVLCHYHIEHPIVKRALSYYCTVLNLDYSVLVSLLHSGSPDSEYAIYRFKKKLRDAFKSKQYRKRIVSGNCQVGRHPMVVMPLPEAFQLRWGTMLQCCGSICCRDCFDWMFSRRALALPNSTTCPICRCFIDARTGEFLWEFCDILEARDRFNQLNDNGLSAFSRSLPLPSRPLPQPTRKP